MAIEKSAESSVPQPSLSKRAGDLPTTRTRTGLSDEVRAHSMSDSIPEKRAFTAYSLLWVWISMTIDSIVRGAGQITRDLRKGLTTNALFRRGSLQVFD